jgi:asparagine synthetase B (glutamine-hydrolysing)
VRVRAAGAGEVWSQLSGGLDSSSVVATAQALHREGLLRAGLAGTVTVVDSLGDGDERAFSDTLLARYNVRNELVRDYWAWQDDGLGAPATDEPRPTYPFFARDRRLTAIVRGAGGRVLLSGLGSDHFLFGNLGFIADLVARGQVTTALREITRWSVAARQSFWRVAADTAVYPFLPAALKRRLAEPWRRVPPWIAADFARHQALQDRLPVMWGLAAKPGEKFHREVAAEEDSHPVWIDREPFNDGLEMRYPFLYRPLVEFALRLPPEMRVQPGARKWLLREAMREELPETIRTRVGKGGIDARILGSFDREGARLARLLRNPILADLGCIDAVALRQAVERARNGIVSNLVTLVQALSLETWLAVRAGAWAAQEGAAQTAA